MVMTKTFMARWHYLTRLVGLAGMTSLLMVSQTGLAQERQQFWTLESAVERVLQIAPETKMAAANTQAYRGDLQQAGVWQNPTISIRADNRIGLDTGRGGINLTQYSINQPLQLFGQKEKQKSIARAGLDASIAQGTHQNLDLERQIALRFHRLQFAMAGHKLAQERLSFADKLKEVGRLRTQAGDMSVLERTRLDLIRETAKQLVDKTEGEYNEARGQFQALLHLQVGGVPKLVPLMPIKNLPPLGVFMEKLPIHPTIVAANYRVEGAKAGVALAKADQLPKVSLNLYREQDLFAGRVQDSHGVGLSVTVPLWDRQQGRLTKTKARVQQGRAEVSILQRDLRSGVQQSYLHLGHLVEQGEHYQLQVFQPSKRVFEMTQKAYRAGEVNILSLIDANNIYFDARSRYLEILQDALLEAAELRFAAGQSIFTTGQLSLQDRTTNDE